MALLLLRLADDHVDVQAHTDQHEEEADDALEPLDEEVAEALDLVGRQPEQLTHLALLAPAGDRLREEEGADQDGEPGDDLPLEVVHGGPR